MFFAQRSLVFFPPNLRFKIVFKSHVTLAVVLASALLVFYNLHFWQSTIAAMWHGTLVDTLFIGSLFIVLLLLHAAFFLLIPGTRALKIIAIGGFFIAALAAYSADTYGVFIDKDMVRNLFETDTREALALLNFRFFAYLLVLGVLPSLLLLRTAVMPTHWLKQIKQRSIFLLLGASLIILLVFAFFAYYSTFAREHKSLRYFLSPGAAIQGTIQYARSLIPDANAGQFVDNSGNTTRPNTHIQTKPLLMFLVIGETARAKNFQLGGYERQTNPELAKTTGLFYFTNVSAYGTSTAVSLPRMFSPLKSNGFTNVLAAHTSNLLDALTKAGVDVEWRDNNSGSKGVSARAANISYNQKSDAALCDAESCFDEVMLQGLTEKLAKTQDDTAIIFHQIGSHGPAYTKRYPPAFEKFSPVCRTNSLKECSNDELRNSYDNTILYTDHNIAQQIKLLQSLSDRFDTILIYVSDHGESLGEKGLYLHGAPYLFAPDEQKKIPMLAWMSEGYEQRVGLTPACLRARLSQEYSHDNLYHTVLGSMNISNDLYSKDLDILAACRTPEK